MSPRMFDVCFQFPVFMLPRETSDKQRSCEWVCRIFQWSRYTSNFPTFWIYAYVTVLFDSSIHVVQFFGSCSLKLLKWTFLVFLSLKIRSHFLIFDKYACLVFLSVRPPCINVAWRPLSYVEILFMFRKSVWDVLGFDQCPEIWND